MTNRELLELAAKAAGIELLWTCGGQPVNVPTLFKGMGSDEVWNPLADDGDALRLAVRLGLLIDTQYNNGVGVGSASFEEVWESAAVDPLAATRLAIVRAAAEIGRNMK